MTRRAHVDNLTRRWNANLALVMRRPLAPWEGARPSCRSRWPGQPDGKIELDLATESVGSGISHTCRLLGSVRRGLMRHPGIPPFVPLLQSVSLSSLTSSGGPRRPRKNCGRNTRRQ